MCDEARYHGNHHSIFTPLHTQQTLTFSVCIKGGSWAGRCARSGSSVRFISTLQILCGYRQAEACMLVNQCKTHYGELVWPHIYYYYLSRCIFLLPTTSCHCAPTLPSCVGGVKFLLIQSCFRPFLYHQITNWNQTGKKSEHLNKHQCEIMTQNNRNHLFEMFLVGHMSYLLTLAPFHTK